VILNRLATDLRVLIDLGFFCIECCPFLEKRPQILALALLLHKPFSELFYLLWLECLRLSDYGEPFIFFNMNKITFFAVVALSFGLVTGQAADRVIFEDSNFSKEGWSGFAEVPGTGGWEIRSRDLGDLAQAVVQEVTIEGSGGIFLSAGSGSYVSVFRSEGVVYAVRSRDGERAPIGQADADGTISLRLGFDGAFLIYEYRASGEWNHLGKSDIIGVVSYTGGISTPDRASDMSGYRIIELESLKGVRFGYTNTHKITGTQWVVHDPFRPQPRQINPGTTTPRDNPGAPPSDAIVLFDGTNLDAWEDGKGNASKWTLRDGFFECGKKSGTIQTKQKFGSVQLHIEWASPSVVKGSSQGRGNSGVFLAGLYEVQVQDNYDNLTYPDGQASALYGFRPPRVNASRPPGVWQAYDIIFEMPEFEEGEVVKKAKFTVFHNGVLTQHAVEIPGVLGHKKNIPYKEHGPGSIQLQDHGNPVRYRNIWIRELKPIQ